MNTVDAFENDIKLQLGFLERFTPQRKITSNAVFCGSGDSLCAAMLAESFSNYTVRACDPLEFTKNPKLGSKKHAYFVSISGNTISNIKAAKLAKTSTAITKNENSKLATVCKNAIILNYVDSRVLTAGSIGFLANALTCISLVFSFKISNIQKLYQQAISQTKKIKPKNMIYFLGGQYTYPIAMYASAKLGEVLGICTHYEKIEQFSHMGLFSAKKGDTIIILEQKNVHNSALAKNLKKLGLHVYNPTIPGSKLNQVLFYIFVSQMLALNLARQKRIKECYFISQKKTRAASSAMIY
ncbi:MAG: SIS domain-containing protein [Candidatus Nitrosotenuis sp.]